jgi:putative PIN family toxin of toxin-antitoxin system
MRAVIDTNIVVSSFMQHGLPDQLIRAWEAKKFDWLLSNALYFEIKDVLFRPYITETYNISAKEIHIFLESLAANCIPVNTDSALPDPLLYSQDVKDNKVLVCAVAGKADYVVTGDKKDLLSMSGHPQLGDIRIITVREFLPML